MGFTMQWGRELHGYELSPLHRTRLYSAGYRTNVDIRDVSAQQMSKVTGLSPDDCQQILHVVFSSPCPKQASIRHRSASDLYKEQFEKPCIITFSEKLDKALGGGIHLGQLTEICGVPGIGKTQLCLQLAVDVQLPTVVGGVGGEVIFIDTKSTFLLERFTEIAKGALKHCQQIATSSNDRALEDIEKFTMETILSGIQYFGCHDYKQLLATVQILPELVKKNGKVKLVLIDSVAFLFRDFEDMFFRTRLLTSLGQMLHRIAKDFQLAVVVTNQMTTRVRGSNDTGSHLVPALGDSWGHSCTVRTILQWEGNRRVACLYKSPSQPRVAVPYQITMDGIRDVLEDSPEKDTTESSENPSKRQRLT